MPTHATTTIVAYGLLSLAGAVSFLMPDRLTVPTSSAVYASNAISVMGVIRRKAVLPAWHSL